MDLRQLECFLEVKEQLHFGRAAERLYLAQPTVSEAIRRLESELGGPLFERTSRRVTLTPLGEVFAVEARRAYDAVTDAYARGKAIAARQANQLLIGHTNDHPPLIDATVALQAAHPGILVTLRAMPTPRLVEAVLDRRLHLAIAWEPDTADGSLADAVIELGSVSAVVPDDHPIAAAGTTTLIELAGEPLIGWPRSANPHTFDLFVAAMDRTGRPWSLVGKASGIDNVVTRVRSGFGVGLVYGTATVPATGVVLVPVIDEHLVFTRRVIWRLDQRHPALAELTRSLVP